MRALEQAKMVRVLWISSLKQEGDTMPFILTKKLLKLWVNWRDQGLFVINSNMKQKEVEEKTSR